MNEGTLESTLTSPHVADLLAVARLILSGVLTRQADQLRSLNDDAPAAPDAADHGEASTPLRRYHDLGLRTALETSGLPFPLAATPAPGAALLDRVRAQFRDHGPAVY